MLDLQTFLFVIASKSYLLKANIHYRKKNHDPSQARNWANLGCYSVKKKKKCTNQLIQKGNRGKEYILKLNKICT